MTIKTFERLEHELFLEINRNRFVLIIKFNGLYIFSDGSRYIYSNRNNIPPGMNIIQFRNSDRFYNNNSGVVFFADLNDLLNAVKWASGGGHKSSSYKIIRILLYFKEYIREYPIIFNFLKMMKIYILKVRKLNFF